MWDISGKMRDGNGRDEWKHGGRNYGTKRSRAGSVPNDEGGGALEDGTPITSPPLLFEETVCCLVWAMNKAK